MIHIKRVWKDKSNNDAYLKAIIHIDDTDFDVWNNELQILENKKNIRKTIEKDSNGDITLWYKVSLQYEYSLCDDRADAFVVALFYFALLSGIDIYSDVAISSSLIYQLNVQLIPLLCKKQKISIVSSILPDLESIGKAVGTGVSCGVDSFSSIFSGLNDNLPIDKRLTHLTLFNTGSFNFLGYSQVEHLKTWWEETEREFNYHIEKGNELASKLELGFICVDSNISDIYQGGFLYSHTYRNLSCVLATQKMWSYYYYASSGMGPVYTPSGGGWIVPFMIH